MSVANADGVVYVQVTFNTTTTVQADSNRHTRLQSMFKTSLATFP